MRRVSELSYWIHHLAITRRSRIWEGKPTLNRYISICLLLLIAIASPLPAQDIHQMARAVDDHYNHLRSLQSDFTEIYRGDGPERVESGTLWLKKPRKMRWEYRSPKEKLFISDGQAVWFYLSAERQLRKTTLKKLDDLRSPLAFLLGNTKLENELQGLSKAVDQAPQGAGNTVLRGIPRAMSGQVSEVQLEITPSKQIVRIVLVDAEGGTTEFRFAVWKENLELSDSRFQFTPPPGVETVEGQVGP
jgi:outer membrane lipoprotein carrier protein